MCIWFDLRLPHSLLIALSVQCTFLPAMATRILSFPCLSSSLLHCPLPLHPPPPLSIPHPHPSSSMHTPLLPSVHPALSAVLPLHLNLVLDYLLTALLLFLFLLLSTQLSVLSCPSSSPLFADMFSSVVFLDPPLPVPLQLLPFSALTCYPWLKVANCHSFSQKKLTQFFVETHISKYIQLNKLFNGFVNVSITNNVWVKHSEWYEAFCFVF